MPIYEKNTLEKDPRINKIFTWSLCSKVKYIILFFITFIFSPHPRIFLLILQREEAIERKTETSLWERNIDQLPPVCTPTGDQTHNLGMCPDQGSDPQLLVHGMMLQPTEPPGQGKDQYLNNMFILIAPLDLSK